MNNEENDIEPIPLTYTQGYLKLPFDQEQFETFVLGLLGRPQSIEKMIPGPFDLNLQDIQNLHYVIDQRIKQQNQATLIQFQSKLFFDDDSSVLLNSYSDLLSYNEVRPLVSVAIQLNWIYLIQFNDREVPEKQEIEIFIKDGFESKHGSPLTILSDLLMSEDTAYERGVVGYVSSYNPHFRLVINHTARTWGVDMEALLSSRLEALRTIDEKPREFVRKYSGSLGFLSFLSVSTLSAFQILPKISAHRKDLFQERQDEVLSMLADKVTVDQKVDLIFSYITRGENYFEQVSSEILFHYVTVGVITLVIASFTSGFVKSLAGREHSSFLVLTSKAGQNREKHLRSQRQDVKFYIISLIVSLLINIMSSHIYSYLVK